ncbi:selenoprotein O and cysteine-containing homologs [Algibacter lectus]|uniref:Selenoprotein O and cysteine-containing homologs n=1 Tax=Algibacter lectus TaxID=221126 RepID=A0A090WRN4_9FLAO|nr:selenoprotein O and cysteine-containing homologs [Algibacter lectus]
MKLNIKDTFTKQLPADPKLENTRRQVENACFSFVTPKQTAKPELLHVSPEMLDSLGLTDTDAKSDTFLKVITGNEVTQKQSLLLCAMVGINLVIGQVN